MFTGIVEEMGVVRSVRDIGNGRCLMVEAEVVMSDMAVGSSIAIDGCCLTVTEFDSTDDDSWFSVEAVPETLNRTTLGEFSCGQKVNLERAVQVGSRLGGHIVQGHVDTVSELELISEYLDGSRRLTFKSPEDVLGHIVEKGSVTLDGISLTVASVSKNSFEVAVIPHTLFITTLGQRDVGDLVNFEADVLARYVAGSLISGHMTVDRTKRPGGETDADCSD